MNLPLGYRYSAMYAGIRKAAKRRPRPDRLRAARLRRRRVHAEPRAGRARAARAAATCRFQGAGRRHPGERRQRQLRHAHRRRRRRSPPARPPPKCCACPWRRCSPPPPASSAWNSIRARSSTPCRRWSQGSRPRRFDDAARRHHDHRPGPQNRLRRSEAAARHGPHRRHDQGLRHDPAAHGHHARLRHDRRRRSRRPPCAPCSSAASNAATTALSVDGDTSTNDTLVLLANGASGVRPDPEGIREARGGASPACWSRSRRQIARDGEGAKKLVTIHVSGAPSDGGRRPDRPRHRQFAPGQNRHRRLRSQLGPHPLRRRQRRRRLRSRAKSISTCRACASAAAASPRRSPKRT